MCKYPDFNNSVKLLLLNEIQSPYVHKRLGKCEYNTLFFLWRCTVTLLHVAQAFLTVIKQLLNVNNEQEDKSWPDLRIYEYSLSSSMKNKYMNSS